MKAEDFNLKQDLVFDLAQGITSFRNNRLVILDAGALGLLRATIVRELGLDRARDLFLRFGYANGYADFGQMKKRYTFDSEMDLLASGPVIHTWEGIVKASPGELRMDRDKGEFYFTGTWLNSWEGEQHLCHFEPSKDPVCWTLTGYASGWSTAFFGKPLIAIEPQCIGKGDAACGWLIQPPAAFGSEADPTRRALASMFEV